MEIINDKGSVCVQLFNGTCINQKIKTKDGKIHDLLRGEVFNTTKENHITHQKFILTGKEKFKPIILDKIRDYQTFIG